MMEITKKLYFIPILLRAFEAEDIQSNLETAFREIERLGKLPEYSDGYRQYEAFILAGIQSTSPEIRNDALTSLLYALATDTFDKPDEVKSLLIEKIHSNPHLKSRYEQICKEVDIPIEKPPITFELERDNELITTVIFSDDERERRVHGIVPGMYSVRLANGRLLWEGTLTSQDVIWEEAFPGVNYTMAADTGDVEQKSTRTEELLDGEVRIALVPGFESGMLVLTVKQV